MKTRTNTPTLTRTHKYTACLRAHMRVCARPTRRAVERWEQAHVCGPRSCRLTWGGCFPTSPLGLRQNVPPWGRAGAVPALLHQCGGGGQGGQAVPTLWSVEGPPDLLPCSGAPLRISTGCTPRGGPRSCQLTLLQMRKWRLAGEGYIL